MSLQELSRAGIHNRGSSEVWALLRSSMAEHTLINKQELFFLSFFFPCFCGMFPSSGNRLELKYKMWRWEKAEVREYKIPELWGGAGVRCREGCNIMKLMWEKGGVSRKVTECIFQHAVRECCTFWAQPSFQKAPFCAHPSALFSYCCYSVWTVILYSVCFYCTG